MRIELKIIFSTLNNFVKKSIPKAKSSQVRLDLYTQSQEYLRLEHFLSV